ncbi:MAG: DUF3579 domain-containing protein [Rugosibacter sp.]
MSPHQAENFIIVGVTLEGRQFRPSDWAERLCGVMSAFGAERRMAYSPHVQPGTHDGYKCVFVDAGIYETEPMAYAFLVNFAKDNQLKVTKASA